MEQFIEPLDYVRYLLALAFVLVVIWVGAWLLKRGMKLGINKNLRQGQEKLQICETLSIDGRNKLVRIQYDGKDHVVILGQHFALRLVSEAGSAPPVATEEAATDEKESELARAPDVVATREEDKLLSAIRMSPQFRQPER